MEFKLNFQCQKTHNPHRISVIFDTVFTLVLVNESVAVIGQQATLAVGFSSVPTTGTTQSLQERLLIKRHFLVT